MSGSHNGEYALHRAIDMLVAQHVLQLPVLKEETLATMIALGQDTSHFQVAPFYSMDEGLALNSVFAKLTSDGWYGSIERWSLESWEVTFSRGKVIYKASCDKLAEAICKAALLTVGIEVEL